MSPAATAGLVGVAAAESFLIWARIFFKRSFTSSVFGSAGGVGVEGVAGVAAGFTSGLASGLSSACLLVTSALVGGLVGIDGAADFIVGGISGFIVGVVAGFGTSALDEAVLSDFFSATVGRIGNVGNKGFTVGFASSCASDGFISSAFGGVLGRTGFVSVGDVVSSAFTCELSFTGIEGAFLLGGVEEVVVCGVALMAAGDFAVGRSSRSFLICNERSRYWEFILLIVAVMSSCESVSVPVASTLSTTLLNASTNACDICRCPSNSSNSLSGILSIMAMALVIELLMVL